ncbi:hypothetical protein QVD17_37423 [Tagetes erecta]|uniref:Uncharacterized protein n=1 Tax=Tagetes erecta TaxID=13708 RepID=A0AAD8NJU9_TARER|nr:hypothetical protein QVD17_37423 [Tagetes erecta]
MIHITCYFDHFVSDCTNYFLWFIGFAVTAGVCQLVCPYWLIRIQEYKLEINGHGMKQRFDTKLWKVNVSMQRPDHIKKKERKVSNANCKKRIKKTQMKYKSDSEIETHCQEGNQIRPYGISSYRV